MTTRPQGDGEQAAQAEPAKTDEAKTLAARDKAKEADRKAAAEAGAPTIQIGGGPDSEVG